MSEPSVASLPDRVRDALARTEAERSRVADELAAYERFGEGVAEIEPVRLRAAAGAVPASGQPATSATTPGGLSTSGGLSSPGKLSASGSRPGDTDATERVRALFEETVWPEAGRGCGRERPGSLTAAMREALGETVAAHLAPSTPGQFTPEVQAAVRTAVEQRRAELRATEAALDREAQSLADARDRFEAIVEWLVTTDETPLLSEGFEGLRARHDALADHRTACDAVAEERQATIRGSTSHGGDVGVAHDSLVAELYDDFPEGHPVLATACRLDAVCAECQRRVRDHLTRRV